MGAGPGGPVPGYVLDTRTASLRAVYGIPGAMQLSPPVNLPFGVISAGFGPAADYVVAVNDQQPPHAFVIQSLSAAAPALTDLGVVSDRSQVLTVNATGSAALLYSGDGSSIQFLTGLPSAPVLSGIVSTAALAGGITAAALDAPGACAILGTGAIETLCSDSTTRQIAPAANLNISALALVNKGLDLVYADRTAKQIVSVSGYAQAGNSTILAAAADGVDTPIALLSSAGGAILVADSSASSPALIAIDATGVHTTPLNFPPTQLRALSDPSLLLLTDPSAVLFTVLDAASMQTYFIPAN